MALNSVAGGCEHMVLLAILRLEDQAYGVSIRREISIRAGRTIAPGALYTTLDRLERKGWLQSREGEPTPERGGRAKRYYSLTNLGADVLTRGHRAIQSLSAGLNLMGITNA